MVNIQDIVDFKLLHEEMDAGYIKVRSHPGHPELLILNYAEKTAFENHWNEATLISRGLIYNQITGEVLARPFAKFFNYGQVGAPEVTLDTDIIMSYDKADGSLGILYSIVGEEYEDSPYYGLNVATRGSFESDQAIWATQFLKDNWEGLYDDADQMIDAGYTPLVEIIYPENRIVLDYEGKSTLKHLGYINMRSGAYTGVPDFNSLLSAIDSVDEFHFQTVGEALDNMTRKNAEGYVLWLDPFTAVKVKQDDYVELHRIVTGLNRKSVWRALSDGMDTYVEMLEQLPDELYAWATGVGSELCLAYGAKVAEADGWYVNVLEYLEDTGAATDDRKAFALAVQKHVPKELQGYMFSIADNRDIIEKVWRSLEPVGGER